MWTLNSEGARLSDTDVRDQIHFRKLLDSTRKFKKTRWALNVETTFCWLTSVSRIPETWDTNCTGDVTAANCINPGEVAPTHYLYEVAPTHYLYEVAPTHYLYEVAWGISWPHGKETISFYIWVTFHMYLCLYIYIRNTLACYLNLYPNYTTVIN